MYRSSLKRFSTVTFDGYTYRQVKKMPLMKFPPKYKTVNIIFGDESRQAILNGISRLTQTSSMTLGPGGRNVVMEYDGGDPKITKDGVTVLKSIEMKHRAEEIGARLLKRSAGYTNIYAGDGTTSSALVSYEILKLGIRAIETQKAHPVALKKGLEKAQRVVSQFLKEIAMPITQKNEIMNVCNVSSNFNQNISAIVAKTLSTVGLDGVINITESPTGETRFALVNGLVIERGYVSQMFAETMNNRESQEEEAQPAKKKNQISMICELEQPLVLVVADKIKSVSQIVPILEMVKIKAPSRSFLLVSEDLQEEPMSTMLYNNQKNILTCCAINVPWVAGLQKEILKDIATITGATLVDNEYILKLEDVQLKHFGTAKVINVDETFTHIVGGNFTKESMDARLKEIITSIETEEKHQMKGVHRERLARMQAKIAEIQIGGSTDVERGEERDIIVDALNSAKSAMQHGVLPGGGVALYQASKLLEDGLPNQITDPSEQLGAKILAKALKEPIRQLIRNKTALEAEPIIDQIEREGNLFTGYNVKTEKVVDMVEEGIVDSLLVVQTYLQDAVTLAGMLLTTEAVIYKEKLYTPLSFKHYQDRRQQF